MKIDILLMLSKNKRKRIYERDGYKCIICGSDEHLSIDHIIPTSKGGTDEDSNLCTMCLRCNRKKANKIEERYLLPKADNEIDEIDKEYYFDIFLNEHYDE